jgi:hypothetical protein
MNALGNLTKDVSGLWMGTIVSFDDQKEQVFGLGWGWRYKVRKIGQDSNDDQIPDANLTYALCLLGPSDGTGGGGRSRSVRYSQGDIVVGFQFQNTPIIFGALGRTSAIKYTKSTAKFAPISGFTQTIKPGLVERQENSESNGPSTPQLRPKSVDENQKREVKKEELKKIGIDADTSAQVDEVPEPLWDENDDGTLSNEEYEAQLKAAAADTTPKIYGQNSRQSTEMLLNRTDYLSQYGTVVNDTPTAEQLQQFESNGWKFTPNPDGIPGGKVEQPGSLLGG